MEHFHGLLKKKYAGFLIGNLPRISAGISYVNGIPPEPSSKISLANIQWISEKIPHEFL